MASARAALTRLAAWPRSRKQLLIAANDAVLLPFAVWAAFAVRMGDPWPDGIGSLWWLFPAVIGVGIPILWWFGLYREVVRHAGPATIVHAVQGCGVTALAVAALILLSGDWAPRSLPIIFFLVALGLILGSRSLARYLLRRAIEGKRTPAIIYGAGTAGAALANALAHGLTFRVVAFVDDDRSKPGTRVRSVPVHDATALERIVAAEGVTHLFLAIPSADRAARRRVLERVTNLPLAVKSVPTMEELASRAASVEDTRGVPIEDLLGRDPVPADRGLLERCVRGKSVLVTGAGGSIGAELCRQALALGPTRLVLFERSEHALYALDQELRPVAGGTELVALLGDVNDRDRLERTLRAFAVETVYHAAAFKHVPMVERNVAIGVENNALGTLIAAEASLACAVETFVLISTDKAVRPTSVMGASKRLAELVLQALAAGGGRTTRFVMVRFGNVLGSSGSVVPLFREQIARGGPLTVTHPDVIRYFMTIPEAAQLVMQAGALADGGEVFLLDMGKPVRIADLAERMIRLAGHTVRDEAHPYGEIEIRFTGLRPGEKLFEELLIGADDVPTQHPRIRKAREGMLSWTALAPLLAELSSACRGNEVPAILDVLHRAVPEFDPRNRAHDLLWNDLWSGGDDEDPLEPPPGAGLAVEVFPVRIAPPASKSR